MTVPAPGSEPSCDRDDAVAIVRRLREAGHVAYFAGGCVRDVLMGLTPTDYDVATDAPPDRICRLFTQTQAVGAAFGVVLVRHRSSVVEVATFRTDGKYQDGRRPTEVKFTTPEEDARRRDFTINGLFQDPIDDKVIDYVGGRADLEKRILRAIGDPDHRFEEDHLRLLRAVRFAARFSLTIEPATASAIAAHAAKLPRISPERIAEELRLMLCPTSRIVAWRQLWRFGLLRQIFRFLPGEHAAQYEAGLFLFDEVAPGQPIPFSLALAAALLCYRLRAAPAGTDVTVLLGGAAARTSVRAARQALHTSNEENDQAEAILATTAPLLATVPSSVVTKKRFLATATSGGGRALLKAIAAHGLHVDRIAQLETELTTLEQTDFAPPPLITGDDLTAAGLQPGPVFKRVLDQVYDAQLESRIKTRDQAMAMAIELSRGERLS
jgi:poly(A) polymerase